MASKPQTEHRSLSGSLFSDTPTMRIVRALLLILLSLGFPALSQAQSRVLYYALKKSDTKIVLPDDIVACGPLRAPDAGAPLGSGGVELNIDSLGGADSLKIKAVKAGSSCPRSESADGLLDVEIQPFLRLDVSSGDLYVQDERRTIGALRFVVDDSDLRDGQLLRNTAFSLRVHGVNAKKMGWERPPEHGLLSYSLVMTDWAPLPSAELLVQVEPVGAPASAIIYGSNGKPLAPQDLTLKFNRWLFAERDLEVVALIPAQSRSEGAKLGGAEVFIPSAILAVIECPAGNCSPKSPSQFKPKRIERDFASSKMHLSFENGQFKKNEEVIVFSLAEKRIFSFPGKPFSELKVKIVADSCSYRVKQLTPLFEGARNSCLYIEVKGEPTSSSGQCKNDLEWRVEGQGIRLNAIDDSRRDCPVDGLHGVMGLVVPSVPSADGGSVSISLYYNGKSQALLSGVAGGQLGLQIERAPLFSGPVRAKYGLLISSESSQDVGVLEDVPGVDKLALGRPNLLYFEAENIGDWSVEPVSPHVRECSPSEWPGGSPAKTKGVLCVVPSRETNERMLFDATYAPGWSRVVKSATGTPPSQVKLGRFPISVQRSSVSLRKALNLEEHAQVVCGKVYQSWMESFAISVLPSLRPADVVATPFTGPRAVPPRDIDHCVLRLLLHSADGVSAGAQLTEEEKARMALRRMGRQEIQVTAHLIPKKEDGRRVSVFSKDMVIEPNEFNLLVRDDGAVEVPIRIKREDSVRLEDYDLIEVKVAHLRGEQYLVAADSFPQSSMSTRLRLMPEWFAGRVTRGMGPRAFITAQIPTGLVRLPNSGQGVVDSTAYGLVEAAVFGAGVMGVVEFYDFDRAAPPLPLNPQLHLGVLLSTTPQAGLKPPRVSVVGGIGLRLLGGVQQTGDTDAGLSTVIWLEYSGRGRSRNGWALLTGFSVNIGSFPN
ncbi:hypothetical protein P2318_27120 [Myxococcaceae bacterium GXIMD 01537]